METKWKEEAGEVVQESGCISIKYEPENDVEHNFYYFVSESEFDEINPQIKVEHCSKSDSGGGALTNILQPEIVEFRREVGSHQNPNQGHRQTFMFEKIPKIETEITGDKPASSSDKEYDQYKIEWNSDGCANFDPELDPFADIDCDPSFSQKPKCHNSHDSSATQEGSSSHLKHFKSLQCPSTFSKRSGLKKHMKSKRNEGAFKCPMPNCEKAFNVKSYVRNHLRRVHSEPRPFKCPEPNCGKTFQANVYLKRHLVRHSKGKPVNNNSERPFKCQECPSTFANITNLTHHVMKSHKNKRFYKCPMPHCEIVYKNNGNLQDHLRRVHSSAKPFMCPEPNCGKTFQYDSNLSMHLDIIHAKKDSVPLLCPEPNCDKIFKHEGLLKYHLKCHMGNVLPVEMNPIE